MKFLPHDVIRYVCEFVPQAQRVAASSGAETTVVWDGDAEEPPRTLRGHRGGVVDIKFFPAGDRLVTVGADNMAVIWSAESAAAFLVLRGHKGARIYEVQARSSAARRVAARAGRGGVANSHPATLSSGMAVAISGHTARFSRSRPESVRVAYYGVSRVACRHVPRVRSARLGPWVRPAAEPFADRKRKLGVCHLVWLIAWEDFHIGG